MTGEKDNNNKKSCFKRFHHNSVTVEQSSKLSNGQTVETRTGGEKPCQPAITIHFRMTEEVKRKCVCSEAELSYPPEKKFSMVNINPLFFLARQPSSGWNHDWNGVLL